MRALILFLMLACASVVAAQVTTNGFQTSTFANLGSVTDGKVRFCTNCAATNPCTGGGSGAYAYRIGGAWVCNNATGSGSSGAPTNATYITQTANATLTNEQALSTLSNGLMRVEAVTGVVSSINTSAGVAANITDETGSSLLVFNTSPSLTTPSLTSPSVTTAVTLDGAVSVSSGSAGDFTIAPTGNIIVNPSGNQINPTTNYDIDLGSNQKKFLSLSAAELLVETLVAQQTIGTIGARILVGPTNQLIADLTSIATTISVKYNNLSNGDRIYMETPGQVEFMAITSGATPITGGYSYSVTRNLDGTGANSWTAGDAAFNTGTTGDGFIDMYSDGGIASGVGPTIVGNVRNSATYNDWTATWAIGNLNGLYGYGADTYGVALGKYAASNNQILIDSTNGIRIRNGTGTVIGQWSTAGVITIGQVGASQDNIQISSGALSIRNNTTERIGMTAAGVMTIKDSSGNAVMTFDASAGAEITRKLTMPGASSAISIGTTPPASAASGTGIWIDRTGLYGLSASVVQTSINSAGILTAGAGNVTLDVNGLTLIPGNATPNSVTWKDALDGSNYVAQVHAFRTGSNSISALNQLVRARSSDTTGYGQYYVEAANSGGFTGRGIFTLTTYSSSHANANKSVAVFSVDNGVVVGNGISTLSVTPDSTILEVRSTTGAFLLPRMSTAQKNALTGTNGMQVYDSTLLTPAFYSGGAWQSVAEMLVSTTTGVDMNTATATTLFTCPSGRTCMITRVVVRNASTSLTTASYSFGWTSAAFNDVIVNATHTELTGNTLYTVLSAKAGSLLGTSTGTFKVLMNTLQGSAATTTMDVFARIF